MPVKIKEGYKLRKQKKENIWLNIGFNLIIPTLLLIKGRQILEYTGLNFVEETINIWIFIIALAFPLFYGVYDLISRKKWNIFSIIGLANVALTGGIGLMSLSKEVMIFKETAVPLIIGLAVLATAPTKKPLAKTIILNDSIVDVEKVENALKANNNKDIFQKQLKIATYLVASSFLISSLLNYILASMIFKSPAGTQEFNAEIGKMTALSFPIIAVPSMIILIFAMLKIFKAITKLTGLELEDIIVK